MQAGWVKIDFQQIADYISKKVQDRRIVSIKVKQEVVCALSNGDIVVFADDTEWPQRLIIASPSLPMKNIPWKGRGKSQVTVLEFYTLWNISAFQCFDAVGWVAGRASGL